MEPAHVWASTRAAAAAAEAAAAAAEAAAAAAEHQRRFTGAAQSAAQRAEPSTFPAKKYRRATAHHMREQCPICLDAHRLESFGLCAHQFCTRCLDEWSRQSMDASCPLCRASVDGVLQPVSPRPEPAASSMPRRSSAWRHAPSQAASGEASSYYRLSTIRERAEREHAERAERHKDRKALEQRLERYRACVFTPSGYPYDSLPTVSLAELRTHILAGNKRNFHGPVSGLSSER